MLRLVFLIALLAGTHPSSAAAQQLIFDSIPGQIVDAVPLHIGMSFDDALAELNATYEPAVNPSDTPHMAVLKRRGDPGRRGTLLLVEENGRVMVIGSHWTPSDLSAGAFAQRLVDLLTLLAPPETGPGRTLDCGLRRMGGPSGSNLVISEIACGRHMVHVVRALAEDRTLQPSLQLVTR